MASGEGGGGEVGGGDEGGGGEGGPDTETKGPRGGSGKASELGAKVSEPGPRRDLVETVYNFRTFLASLIPHYVACDLSSRILNTNILSVWDSCRQGWHNTNNDGNTITRWNHTVPPQPICANAKPIFVPKKSVADAQWVEKRAPSMLGSASKQTVSARLCSEHRRCCQYCQSHDHAT